jgi:cold shock protein
MPQPRFGVDRRGKIRLSERRQPSFGSSRWPALTAFQVTPKNLACCCMRSSVRLINRSLKGNMMPRGTVKFFNTQKGFGFIQPDDGSKDVFVHITAVERAGWRTLNEGQKISYEIVTERGKQAAGNLQAA